MEFVERVRAGLANFIIGDAIGAPVEGLHYTVIDRRYGRYGVRGLVEPPEDHPMRHMRSWRVTDDSEMLIFTIRYASKVDRPTIESYVYELVKWAKETGLLAKHYYGSTTRKALAKLLEEPADPSKYFYPGETNGGPIRSIVAGLVNPGHPENACREAIIYCKPTHGSSVALSAACVISPLISMLIHGIDPEVAIRASLKYGRLGFKEGSPTPSPSVARRVKLAMKIVRRYSNLFKAARVLHDIIGPGYHSAEAIPIAIALFYAGIKNPDTALLAAVNMGGDTDSIAALTGLLLGIYTGRIINMEWYKNVISHNNIDLHDLVKCIKKAVELRLSRNV